MKELKEEKDSGLRCSCGETEEHLLILDKANKIVKCRKCVDNEKLFENVPKENF